MRVQTDAASEQDAAGADTIEPKMTEPEDVEHEADAAYSDQPDTAVSDDPPVDQSSHRDKPAKGKLTFRLPWTRSEIDDGERGRHPQPRVHRAVRAPVFKDGGLLRIKRVREDQLPGRYERSPT